MHAFTIKSHGGLANVLVTPVRVLIPSTSNQRQFNGIWDTGATASAVSSKVIAALGLLPTGMSQVHTANGIVTQSTYIVDILLPNSVTIKDVTATGVSSLTGNCDLLIGMDIIRLGDFSITNHNNSTCMSFRIPSSHHIDYVENPGWTADLRVKKQPAKNTQNPYTNVGRNDPCPCGSNLKYKHCHGKTK